MSSANFRWPASSFSAKSYALATTSSGLGSWSTSGSVTDGSLGVMDWTVSIQDLMASMTVSWLLRMVFRNSSILEACSIGAKRGRVARSADSIQQRIENPLQSAYDRRRTVLAFGRTVGRA